MFTDPPNSTGTSKKGNANLANRKLAAFATRDIMKVRPAVTGRSSRPRRSILVKIHLRRKNCTITTISSMTHNRAKKIISDPRARGSAIKSQAASAAGTVIVLRNSTHRKSCILPLAGHPRRHETIMYSTITVGQNTGRNSTAKVSRSQERIS